MDSESTPNGRAAAGYILLDSYYQKLGPFNVGKSAAAKDSGSCAYHISNEGLPKRVGVAREA